MLDSLRIREAEENVRRYLAEGLLKREKGNPLIIERYAKNAEESLHVAGILHQQKLSPLWVIVCSYYAMYYIANAVLRTTGYAAGEKISHKVTADALIVFVRGRLKERFLEEFEEMQEDAVSLAEMRASTLLEHFDAEKKKRSVFQYNMNETAKQGKAETSLARAKEFMVEMAALL